MERDIIGRAETLVSFNPVDMVDPLEVRGVWAAKAPNELKDQQVRIRTNVCVFYCDDSLEKRGEPELHLLLVLRRHNSVDDERPAADHLLLLTFVARGGERVHCTDGVQELFQGLVDCGGEGASAALCVVVCGCPLEIVLERGQHASSQGLADCTHDLGGLGVDEGVVQTLHVVRDGDHVLFEIGLTCRFFLIITLFIIIIITTSCVSTTTMMIP